jgi:hypothetical protein
MAPPDLYRVLLDPFNKTGLEYMVTGGVAAIAYGEPRLTNDVDIVVRGSASDAPAIIAQFAPDTYYAPPLEVLREELGRPRHGHFNLIHLETGLRADIYVAGDDDLHAWALARRHAESVGGGEIWLAPIEYVIIRKLEYFAQMGSERHLRDVNAMVRISGDLVDRSALERLIRDRRLDTAWEAAQRPNAG